MTRIFPAREITQGSIFSCARAFGYPDSRPFGLVVTARCDHAHGKADIVNFLPIIPVIEWMRNDGARIVAQREQAGALSSIQEILELAELDATLLETTEMSTIRSIIESNINIDTAKILKRFDRSSEDLKTAVHYLSNHPSNDLAVKLLKRFDSQRKRLAKDLIGHSVADAHFLEAVEPDEDADGYVIRLREVRSLPSEVAFKLAEGIGIVEAEQLCNEPHERMALDLSIIAEDDYAMPVGVVRSPDIEFILQRFTQLFARVGVEDIAKSRLARVIESTGTDGAPTL